MLAVMPGSYSIQFIYSLLCLGECSILGHPVQSVSELFVSVPDCANIWFFFIYFHLFLFRFLFDSMLFLFCFVQFSFKANKVRAPNLHYNAWCIQCIHWLVFPIILVPCWFAVFPYLFAPIWNQVFVYQPNCIKPNSEWPIWSRSGCIWCVARRNEILFVATILARFHSAKCPGRLEFIRMGGWSPRLELNHIP